MKAGKGGGLIRYIVVSSSNFMYSNFSRSLMYSQMNQRQV